MRCITLLMLIQTGADEGCKASVACQEVGIRARLLDAAFVEEQDTVALRQKLQLVGHQQDGLPCEQPSDAVIKDVSPNVRIDGRERVV